MSAAAAAAGGEGEEFSKPGQKFATPSPGSGARVFYETLLMEKPDCIMALAWCVEHGIAMGGAASDAAFKRLQALRAKAESKGRK